MVKNKGLYIGAPHFKMKGSKAVGQSHARRLIRTSTRFQSTVNSIGRGRQHSLAYKRSAESTVKKKKSKKIRKVVDKFSQ